MTGPRSPRYRILQELSTKESIWGDKFQETGGSPLNTLSEAAMRGRVLMLKRMKRNLIIDWHPIIDILLNDYERDLRRLEILRHGPDEPDVLDRDFDEDDGCPND